jgi:hypothetical protein
MHSLPVNVDWSVTNELSAIIGFFFFFFVALDLFLKELLKKPQYLILNLPCVFAPEMWDVWI